MSTGQRCRNAIHCQSTYAGHTYGSMLLLKLILPALLDRSILAYVIALVESIPFFVRVVQIIYSVVILYFSSFESRLCDSFLNERCSTIDVAGRRSPSYTTCELEFIHELNIFNIFVQSSKRVKIRIRISTSRCLFILNMVANAFNASRCDLISYIYLRWILHSNAY